MMIEDFTRLSVGSIVSKSRTIIRCPRCQRLGALELRADGSRRCVHVEASSIQATEIVVEPQDSCEIAGPRSVPAGLNPPSP